MKHSHQKKTETLRDRGKEGRESEIKNKPKRLIEFRGLRVYKQNLVAESITIFFLSRRFNSGLPGKWEKKTDFNARGKQWTKTAKI